MKALTDKQRKENIRSDQTWLRYNWVAQYCVIYWLVSVLYELMGCVKGVLNKNVFSILVGSSAKQLNSQIVCLDVLCWIG